jgi:hypothetical protein
VKWVVVVRERQFGSCRKKDGKDQRIVNACEAYHHTLARTSQALAKYFLPMAFPTFFFKSNKPDYISINYTRKNKKKQNLLFVY